MQLLKIYVILMATFLQMKTVDGKEGMCDGKTFKGAEGEFTSPGYPHHLGFTKTCFFKINVGSGGIELTFDDVDLPVDSSIGVLTVTLLDVGFHHNLNSRVMYVDRKRATVVFILPNNFTGSFGGVKVHFKRIPKGVCKYSMMAHYSFERIKSPAYPYNYAVNSTCEYHIDVFSKDHVVHIGFQDMEFGPNDTFTVYDVKDNRVLLGPVNGPQKWIRTEPTNSSSVKIVIVANDAPSSATRKYVFFYKEVPKKTCLQDHYERQGVMSYFSSAVGKNCTDIVRSHPKDRIVIWLKSIDISPGNRIVVTLKSGSNEEISKSYLYSNNSGLVRMFDGLEEGYLFEITQSSNASFQASLIAYKQSTDSCPFYVISEVIEKQITSPGYPGNISPNTTCEYYIRSKDQTGVVQIQFSELFLSAFDSVFVVNAFDSSIITSYRETNNSTLSTMTNSSSARVVFTTGPTEPTMGRRFTFFHKILDSETCTVDYEVGKSWRFSSLDRACEYNIHLKSIALQIDLKFENLYIPMNRTIKVVQKIERLQQSLADLSPKDSGKTKYFRSRKYYKIIVVYADANTLFDLSFKPFVSESTINLRGTNGTLLSPNFPDSYLMYYFEHTIVTYHVQVAIGHVLLNFTEAQLSWEGRYYSDRIEIYDGNSTSSQEISTIRRGQPGILPVAFLSSSNYFTVKFLSVTEGNPEKLYRFKATYTMVDQAEVNHCKAFDWPYSHADRNLTFPGRTTKFFCDEGYVRKSTYNYVTRTCDASASGEWQPGETLKCLKTCPRLAYKDVYEGVSVIFHCSSYKDELHGPDEITCTAHGNYSASLPVCKRRRDRGSGFPSSGNNGWKYGVGFGGAAFIITIVLAVLKIFFGCFDCCSSSTGTRSIPMRNVEYSKQTEAI